MQLQEKMQLIINVQETRDVPTNVGLPPVQQKFSKPETSNQCLTNVGPTSTVGQHWSSMPRVGWELQSTQNICITFIQCWTNGRRSWDVVVEMFYKCLVLAVNQHQDLAVPSFIQRAGRGLALDVCSGLILEIKGVVNCQNSRDKGPPEGNSARG